MRPPGLTTHVLDTAAGVPAAGVTVELWRASAVPTLVARAVTDADGRTGRPLLDAAAFAPGRYELRFSVGDYFAARGEAGGFLDVVTVSIGLREGGGHYHVPLLCSPWSYATYRGS